MATLGGTLTSGKKFASGTATINTGNYTITVSGLSFTPSIIIVGGWHSDPEIQQYGTVYNNSYWGGICFAFCNRTADKVNVGTLTSSACYVVNGGFRLPGTGTAGFGGTTNWIAFE